MHRIKSTLLICMAAMAVSAIASATPLTYCLSGVVFDDGGTASGCFTFETSNSSVTGVNIVTTNGSTLPGATYIVSFIANPGGALFFTSTSNNQTGLPALVLRFTPSLGTASSVAIQTGGLGQEFSCVSAGCLGSQPPIRNVTAGVALQVVDNSYQLRYLANLDKGDSYINLTNAGTLNGFDPAGRICVNVYTFDPAEELISCCACPVTPNGLNTLSARNDLISNTLTPGVPTSITVKLLGTVPGQGGACDASAPTAANLVRGVRAWATTLHLNTSGSPAVGYQTTETPFSSADLSATELTKLTSYCSFIQANGSGFGLCKSCRAGALGASLK